MGPISTNDINMINTFGYKTCDYFISIESSSWTSQNSSTLILQFSNELLIELDRMLFSWVEAHEAIFHTIYLLAAILCQSSVNFSYDDIQAGTQPSTGHNRCFDLSWLKM